MNKNVVLCVVTALVVTVLLGACYLLGNRYAVVAGGDLRVYKLDKLTGQMLLCDRAREYPITPAD